jgi:hypothetical protein
MLKIIPNSSLLSKEMMFLIFGIGNNKVLLLKLKIKDHVDLAGLLALLEIFKV